MPVPTPRVLDELERTGATRFGYAVRKVWFELADGRRVEADLPVPTPEFEFEYCEPDEKREPKLRGAHATVEPEGWIANRALVEFGTMRNGVIVPDEPNTIPEGSRVALDLAYDDEDGAWRTQGRQRFEAAYAPEDSVYDQLMDETR